MVGGRKRKAGRIPRRAVRGDRFPPHGFYTQRSAGTSFTCGSAGDPAANVARIRAELQRAIERRPGDLRTLLRASEGLRRAAVAQHRMSPAAGDDLPAKTRAVLDSLQDQLIPPV